jgi:GTPase Era involved in 16S rRNA processing
MTKTDIPCFAVVGHPNKGKSSIVATLSQNDSVVISQCSGTTRQAERYTVGTDNGSYILVDTPGFQRPAKALRWLNEHCGNASERAATVKRFVNDAECRQAFPDEVSLLTPIVEGAAILYVVDGSRPYGAEYEAEMEILRWTGQPGMALINPIENEDHIDEWHNALVQFFKSVQVFNPMTAEFDKQIAMLSQFRHLNSHWNESLQSIIAALQQQRDTRKKVSATILARLVDDLCNYRQSQKVLSKKQAEMIESLLKSRFEKWMTKRESLAIRELLANFAHLNTSVNMAQLTLPPELLDYDHWYVWGLDKMQLVTAASATGAVSGAAIGLMAAGHGVMVGAIAGGLIAAGSAWLGADKMAEIKLKGLPLGGYNAIYGPVRNRNFPYVVIGRFLYLYRQIANLSHANRRPLSIAGNEMQDTIARLESSQQKKLHQACERLVKQKTVDDLETVLLPLFD